ncbi:MAG: HAMP domain-containing protein [Polynucleobacter sp.]|nr:MAG: HAMP domain-containing protein [Polynucleobacter sp.]
MFSITFTLWVTWKLEGGAAAINEAGRMRMQTYQLALLANHDKKSQVMDLVSGFDKSLTLLSLGDPARPLFVPWNESNKIEFAGIQNDWLKIKSILVSRQDQALSASHAESFVNRIDRFVSSIETEVDYWTGLLHLFQFGMLAISLITSLVIMYVGYSVILDPVAKLRLGFDRVTAGNLKTHVVIDAKDEFGDLAVGFNEMTKELRDLYEGLEAKVKEKTLHLEEKQTRLAALYEISSFIAKEDDLSNLTKGFSSRLLGLVKCDALAIRWTDEANQRYFLDGGSNLPESISDNEHCLTTGSCYCGSSQESGEVKVINFNKHLEIDRLCVKEGFATLVTLPVALQNKLMGEVDIFFKKETVIDSEQKSLLLTLANHLAGALEAQKIKALEKEATISEERSLLARELHDSIAQSLAFLKLQVGLLKDALRGNGNADPQKILSELDLGLKESYGDVRELLLHFRTRTNIEDIEPALKSTLQKFEHQSGIPTKLEMIGDGLPLPPDIQIQVMHILQEALSNVRKHAEARNVKIVVNQSPNWSFEVIDDGKGFNSEKHDSTHVGMSIMQERAEKINATIKVRSVPNVGTRVLVELS